MAVWSSASSTALNFQAGRRYTHTHVLDAIAAIFLFSVILDRNPSICNVQSHTHTHASFQRVSCVRVVWIDVFLVCQFRIFNFH